LVPRALQAGVDLGFEDAGDDAPAAVEVQGNALLLREALVNLIDNAVRYAGRGSEVTVRARQSGRDACIVVEDNGPGIPSADRERVFERFVRATHEGSGCGLGLAIVKEIAEQHGGEVTLADAHPGRQPPGLRAALRLPARVNTV
jgi:two-component system sensor histidine kinase TctE